MSVNKHCQECGMLLDDPGEYHPYEFCVLKKARPSRNPWDVVERFAQDLCLGKVHRGITVRQLQALRSRSDDGGEKT